ncbi:hypothetical protein TRVL_06913 [Trypanosoma vivax]|nr:hypothetical protein TRVL_06913 [Trypanosoma vivax]
MIRGPPLRQALTTLMSPVRCKQGFRTLFSVRVDSYAHLPSTDLPRILCRLSAGLLAPRQPSRVQSLRKMFFALLATMPRVIRIRFSSSPPVRAARVSTSCHLHAASDNGGAAPRCTAPACVQAVSKALLCASIFLPAPRAEPLTASVFDPLPTFVSDCRTHVRGLSTACGRQYRHNAVAQYRRTLLVRSPRLVGVLHEPSRGRTAISGRVEVRAIHQSVRPLQTGFCLCGPLAKLEPRSVRSAFVCPLSVGRGESVRGQWCMLDVRRSRRTCSRTNTGGQRSGKAVPSRGASRHSAVV